MGKPPSRGRLSQRDQRIAINAAFDHWSAISGRPTPPGLKHVLPPKRDRIRRPWDGKPAVPLEKEVLADVLKALRSDPRVGFVWRQTSGTFQDGDRYIKAGPRGMPDVLGVLVGTGTFFAIEVKRPGGKPDAHQEERLEHFRRCGAIAGYCWSSESALALLP